jgi:hypothetical protein
MCQYGSFDTEQDSKRISEASYNYKKSLTHRPSATFGALWGRYHPAGHSRNRNQGMGASERREALAHTEKRLPEFQE